MYRSYPIYLMVFLFFAVPNIIDAQKFSSIITDETGAPIHFATIYDSGKKTGTLSEADGGFILDLAPEQDTSMISFSCIGYKSLSLSTGELKELARSKTPVILSAKGYVLETTEVTAKKIKIKRKLLKMRGILNATYGFAANPDRLPLEQGTILRPDGRCRIDEVILKIREMEADSVLLDVNVYEFRFGRVLGPLLKERVFLSLAKSEIGGKIRIPLTEQNIVTDKPFIVSIRVLRVNGTAGNFSFAGKTGNNRGRQRVYGGKWVDSYVTPAFAAEVSYLE